MICRLCTNTNLVPYYTQGKAGQFKYYKCQNCSLVNLDLSNVDITDNQNKYSDKFHSPIEDNLNIPAVHSAGFIKKYLSNSGSFLDIGCGNGSLMLRLKNLGWEVRGIELTEYLVEKVTSLTGMTVESANFMEYYNYNQSYDLVALRHVLEHIPDSVKVMNSISNLLVENGHALIEFPNIEAPEVKFKRFLNRSGLHRKKYKESYLPGHCNEFSLKSFNHLVGITGFEIVATETYSHKSFNNKIHQIFRSGNKIRTLIKKRN